jgi:hypothetical protein
LFSLFAGHWWTLHCFHVFYGKDWDIWKKESIKSSGNTNILDVRYVENFIINPHCAQSHIRRRQIDNIRFDQCQPKKVTMVNPKTEGAIHIDDVDLESVIDFNYLGSTISADGNIIVEIKQRIGKANTAYNTLQNIWRSKIYSTKTKIRIYKSGVRTVLLHGAETWKTDKRIESMLRGFEGRLLRRMLGFTREDKSSNVRLKELTGLGDINKEVIKRHWR